jgi:hypothetical protein
MFFYFKSKSKKTKRKIDLKRRINNTLTRSKIHAFALTSLVIKKTQCPPNISIHPSSKIIIVLLTLLYHSPGIQLNIQRRNHILVHIFINHIKYFVKISDLRKNPLLTNSKTKIRLPLFKKININIFIIFLTTNV